MKMPLLQPGNGDPVGSGHETKQIRRLLQFTAEKGLTRTPTLSSGFWVSSRSSCPVVTTARHILANPGPLEWGSAIMAFLACRTVSFATSNFH